MPRLKIHNFRDRDLDAVERADAFLDSFLQTHPLTSVISCWTSDYVVEHSGVTSNWRDITIVVVEGYDKVAPPQPTGTAEPRGYRIWAVSLHKYRQRSLVSRELDGYVSNPQDAGLFTYAEALAICKDQNYKVDPSFVEAMVPVWGDEKVYEQT